MRGHGQSFGPWERELLAANGDISTVISAFAIVILSIIGSLFARNHHMVMGLDEDPEDHAAVASSIFITVAVYAVWHLCVICKMYTNVTIGLLPILWFSSVAESKTKQEGRYLATMKNAGIEYGK